MSELKKAIWICYVIQTILILSLILVLIFNNVFASHGVELIPDNLPWIVPIIYISNVATCFTLITIPFSRALKKIDPDEHAKAFSLYPFFHNGFENIAHVFNSNSENATVKKLYKIYFVNCGLLLLIILAESAVGHILLTLIKP